MHMARTKAPHTSTSPARRFGPIVQSSEQACLSTFRDFALTTNALPAHACAPVRSILVSPGSTDVLKRGIFTPATLSSPPLTLMVAVST
jgi:hypothetical protein